MNNIVSSHLQGGLGNYLFQIAAAYGISKRDYKELIIDISEKNLEPIKNLNFHKKFSNYLKKINYNKIITYEVMKCENIMDSVKKFYDIYK